WRMVRATTTSERVAREASYIRHPGRWLARSLEPNSSRYGCGGRAMDSVAADAATHQDVRDAAAATQRRDEDPARLYLLQANDCRRYVPAIRGPCATAGLGLSRDRRQPFAARDGTGIADATPARHLIEKLSSLGYQPENLSQRSSTAGAVPSTT